MYTIYIHNIHDKFRNILCNKKAFFSFSSNTDHVHIKKIISPLFYVKRYCCKLELFSIFSLGFFFFLTKIHALVNQTHISYG